MTSLESTIETAQMFGYRINNLFERMDGRWQANVSREAEDHEFGEADTPNGALEEALRKAGLEP